MVTSPVQCCDALCKYLVFSKADCRNGHNHTKAHSPVYIIPVYKQPLMGTASRYWSYVTVLSVMYSQAAEHVVNVIARMQCNAVLSIELQAQLPLHSVHLFSEDGMVHWVWQCLFRPEPSSCCCGWASSPDWPLLWPAGQLGQHLFLLAAEYCNYSMCRVCKRSMHAVQGMQA